MGGLKGIANHTRKESWSCRLRNKRMAPLLPYTQRALRVVDLGGAPNFWAMLPAVYRETWSVTTVNLSRQMDAPGVAQIVGDATTFTDFKDCDLIFSNSMIEHVGGWAARRRLADNILASGKSYFLQTPNFWFPIEPHFLFPYFQLLPRPLQTWLLRNFDIGWSKRMAYDEAHDTLDFTELLTRRDMKALFPKAQLIDEKIAGLTKSFVAVDLSALDAK